MTDRADPRATLRAEAAALAAAAERLDSATFAAAVDLLLGCKGKVITTGAGTSGVIAHKIAATLTSTGTPSVYLSPTDAVHGQLGIVTGDDVVVAVSNGGETAEVVALLPYLRQRSVPVVAVVGNLASTLAKAATVALDAAVDREACPLDITPTSSTTVAMALGDAIALQLLEHRGLTREAFAVNHPSGRLGRRLTLRVSDLVAAAGADVAVGRDDPLLDVVGKLSSGGVGAVTVIGPGGVLEGIITDGDLRRAVERRAVDLVRLRAADVMTAGPATIRPSALAFEALEVMEARPSPISVLPIVADDGTCLGVLRLHDLVRAGL